MKKIAFISPHKILVYFIMDLLKANFLREEKSRFKCKILLNHLEIDCYVPCSCKISKIFLIKEGTQILITKNKKKKSKLEYSIVAVKNMNNYLIINPSLSNYAYKAFLASTGTDYFSEYSINEYRTDFFIPQKKEVIEIKSILSETNIVSFPQINSERFLLQLKSINQLLDEKYTCKLIFSIFNPTIKKIKFDSKKKIYKLLIDCLAKGLIIECVYCFLDDKNEPSIIKGNIEIEY